MHVSKNIFSKYKYNHFLSKYSQMTTEKRKHVITTGVPLLYLTTIILIIVIYAGNKVSNNIIIADFPIL